MQVFALKRNSRIAQFYVTSANSGADKHGKTCSLTDLFKNQGKREREIAFVGNF